MRPINLELSLAQKFELKRITDEVTKLSREQLENSVIDLVTQAYAYRNAVTSLMMPDAATLGISEKQKHPLPDMIKLTKPEENQDGGELV